MNRFDYRMLGLCAALAGVISGAGCGDKNPLDKVTGGLKDACGLWCPGEKGADGVKIKGVLEGNGAISGVASLDAFFSSVVKFDTASANVCGGIEAQLDAIRADFGLTANGDIGAELKAKIDANLKGGIEGGLKVDYQPAKCSVDAHATLEATAKCDASVDPGKATIKCEGTCKLDADAEVKCDASAELQCTVTDPSVMCGGTCEGDCTLDVSASGECSGTCEGSCEGTCSVKNTDGSCAGECSGKCGGTCKAKLEADGSCMAKCSGSCTAKAPEAGCSGGAQASCKAMGSVMAECKGSCDGDFEPPKAKAECQASAKADASVNVQCTPPQLALSYQLAASLEGSANLEARAKFEASLKTLFKLRLPALLEAAAKAKFVASAGENLAATATGAVSDSVKAAAKAAGTADVKASFGLICAGQELPKVGMALDVATERLTTNLSATASITSKLGIGG